MPSPRPRFVVRGRFASAYLPKEYMAWKENAAETLAAVPGLPPPDMLDKAFDVIVDLTCVVEKPRTSKLKRPSPDVDNYAKSVLDAVTQSGAWWADDSQVTDLRIRKRWAEPGERPGVEVSITYQ